MVILHHTLLFTVVTAVIQGPVGTGKPVSVYPPQRKMPPVTVKTFVKQSNPLPHTPLPIARGRFADP